MEMIKYKGGFFNPSGFTEAKADVYLAEAEARKPKSKKKFAKEILRDEQERDLGIESKPKSKKSDKDKI